MYLKVSVVQIKRVKRLRVVPGKTSGKKASSISASSKLLLHNRHCTKINALYALLHSNPHNCEIDTIIICIFQMRKIGLTHFIYAHTHKYTYTYITN